MMPHLIAPGGTVYDLAVDHAGHWWLATEAGLWSGRPGHWEPVADLPLPRVAAVALLEPERSMSAGLLIGGAGIAWSRDGGATWVVASTDGSDAPVTCLAVAPARDGQRTVLAGTNGSGVLRSTDGGRSWRLSGAGLEEFVVLALAVAPVWGRREEVFALTTGGLYRSPNGGRYWQRVLDCLDGPALQALALSPSYAEDRVVYAGGEPTGVWRSDDGGRSWHALASGPGGINCLLALAGATPTLLAGTVDGAIWRSADGGASWTREVAQSGSILALGQHGNVLLAGAHGTGLLHSAGAGRWQVEPELALRDLTRLAQGGGGELLAYGPGGGLWHERGGSWRQLIPGDLHGPIACLLTLGGGALLIGTLRELLAIAPAGEPTVLGAPGDAAVTALARQATTLWLGDAGGRIWRREGGAQRWELELALAGAPVVVSLAATAGAGAALLAAAWFERAGRIQLWRRELRGGPWGLWLEAPSPWARVALSAGEPVLVGTGPQLWHSTGAGWEARELDGRPVVAVCRDPARSVDLAATTGAIYRRREGLEWERLPLAVPSGGLLDLLALPDGRLVGLGRGGVLVEYELP